MNRRPAHVDPEELHNFADHLKSFNERLDQDAKRLMTRFKGMGSSCMEGRSS